MKSMMKLFLVSLLILSMLLTAIACNNSATPTTATTDTTATSGTTGTTATTQTTAGNPEPLPDPQPTVEMLPAQKVNIAGINVLCSTGNIDKRAELLAPMLEALELDSFGVQECVSAWETRLDTYFGDRYARVGVDVNGKPNSTSFATYIYYLKDKYVAIDSGTFWMSKTPDKPSKYGSTVDMNRTCTWALLENIETGFRYVHMNCHIDWMDMEVNAEQCKMLLAQFKRFEAMGYPVFLTGDHNMREDTESYAIMTAHSGLADSRYIADVTTDMITAPTAGTIDYCFVTKNTTTVQKFDLIETQTNPQISDHRGVFVSATVKSLPKQELYSSTPEFAEDATVEISTSMLSTSVTMILPQATDIYGSVARNYLLEICNHQGKTIVSETISSGYHLPEQPESILYSMTLPDANTYYTLRLTPIGLFGNIGTPLVQCFSNKMEPQPPAEPEEVGKGDIVDIRVVNGEVKDTSTNAYTYQTYGTVNVTGNSFSFSDNGNLKLEQIKDHYSTLGDGFSVVASFTTPSSFNASQNIFANCHAGGFAIAAGEGRIGFQIHINGEYVVASFEAKANTTYHVVGVYDPTVGVLLYVNGQLVAVTTVPANATVGLPTVDGAKYLCIGADSDATGKGEYFFKGSITSAAMYSTPLTAGNVTYLYQNQ